MTEKYPPAFTPPQDEPLRPAASDQQNTADMVKDQAAELSHSGVQAGKRTADVARGQASEVAAEAGRQVRDLLGQAQDQLGDQAARGQQRLASELLSFSDQLSSMAEDSSQGGMTADLARQLASRVRDAGQWLSDRRPPQVVDEVQSFASRRPAIFLAMAAGAGLVAGRLTRGIKDASSNDQEVAAPAASRGMPETTGQRAQPPGEAPFPAGTAAGYPAGTVTGVSGDVSGPAGGLPGAGRVPGWDPGTDFGDHTATARDQAARKDRP